MRDDETHDFTFSVLGAGAHGARRQARRSRPWGDVRVMRPWRTRSWSTTFPTSTTAAAHVWTAAARETHARTRQTGSDRGGDGGEGQGEGLEGITPSSLVTTARARQSGDYDPAVATRGRRPPTQRATVSIPVGSLS
jgi:hypothetical protein